MPGILNSESHQVTHDSQGLKVTVRISDDSTSNNNNNTADDSTLGPTNNNHADDLTSTNNSADDLTSTSPPVVTIGRGGRLARPNNSQTPLLSDAVLDKVGVFLPRLTNLVEQQILKPITGLWLA